LIHVEKIRRPEAAHVKVGASVVVNISKRSPLFPVSERSRDSGALSDVLEFELAQVSKEAIQAGLADDKNIGPSVCIVIANRHARTDRTERKLAVQLPPHARIVVGVERAHSGVLRRQRSEHRLSAWPGALGERGGLQTARYSGPDCGRRYKTRAEERERPAWTEQLSGQTNAGGEKHAEPVPR
jgi:hypothetical protein